jgi:diguanylate cyclase (GGDEF)-like protein
MTLQSLPDLPPLPLFHESAVDLLAMLRRRLGFRIWIAARVKDGEWRATVVDGDAYGIRAGHTFDWQSTLCSRMVEPGAPRFAADVQQVHAYAATAFAAEFRIGAYIGVPLYCADGTLMATLCAFDPAPRHDITADDVVLVETCARVLTRLVHADLRTTRQRRKLERTEAVAFCDALTGLYNRRGWDQLLRAEESRCRRHGRGACIVSVDLDDLKIVNDSGGHERGDDLLRRAARALRSTIRTQDVAARVGGDEFAILAVECDGEAVAAPRRRLEDGLAAAGVGASLGLAVRDAEGDLSRAWREADEAMYRAKRERKSAARVRVSVAR